LSATLEARLPEGTFTMKRIPIRRVWVVVLGISGSVIAGLWGVSGLLAVNSNLAPVVNNVLPQPAEVVFTKTDDATVQQRELLDFVQAFQQPHRLLQVDLAQHPKISQFTDINSSAKGYGKNACGLVAAAAALGGKDWTTLLDQIAQAAGENYSRNKGIQPSKYIAALQTVLGAENVNAQDNGTLGDLYRALGDNRVVIVDIKVNAVKKVPSIMRPHYAHFTRVLGLDLDKAEIYLENTLAGDPYWTVPLADFVAAWLRPETTASIILAPREAENVTRWSVALNNPTAP
jgi:hypothetical protein